MTTAALLLTATAGLAAGIVLGRRFPRAWLGVTSGAMLAAFAAAMRVLVTGAPWEWRSAFAVAGARIHVRLDSLSAFFLVLLCLVGGAAASYMRGYWPDDEHPQSAGWSRLWWSAMLLALGGVFVASNGLHFLIAWELFAVFAYLLITLERHRVEVRAAGWLYLAASHAGTLCLFAFFALLASRTGSWELAPMQHRSDLAPLFWLALLGFGVKAGFFPLHIWLPSAHANAPSHVSAILSGVAIKLGVYGLLRFTGWLPTPDSAGWVLMAVGAVTAVLAIAFALAQTDLKRLLAYSSVENIGIILVGLGAALLGKQSGNAGWGRLALAGALLHVWNHGLFKSLLFLGAGSVLHATGTREMSRLGGLWRSMPWTTGLFAVGAVAVCALPPLNGFVSEWLIYVGLFDAVATRSAAASAAVPAAIMLGITGALALASFVKAATTVFLGAPRTAAARDAHESGWWMRGPMLAGAGLCAIAGAAPVLLWPALDRVVAALYPIAAAASGADHLSSLSKAQTGIGALVLLAVGVLAARTRRRPVPRGPTWDCGYELPSARMQYTSGSFGGIVSGWFRWILLPRREVRRPRGYFPVDARRLERVPETVLERVLHPAGRAILAASNAVRRLQHGRLQFYVAYVVIGLAGLTALVALGEMP